MKHVHRYKGQPCLTHVNHVLNICLTCIKNIQSYLYFSYVYRMLNTYVKTYVKCICTTVYLNAF